MRTAPFFVTIELSATPETAYRFAMGRPVVSPTTHTRWQLSTPLDFLVVADHAEAVGSIPRIFRGDPVVADTKTGQTGQEGAPEGSRLNPLSRSS